MQNERQPLYIQIQEHFKERIKKQKLRPGERIPTEKELMEQFGVSRITVANALAELAKDGWISRIPGRGSFVNDKVESALQKPDSTPSAVAVKNDSPIGSSRRMIGLVMPSLADFFAIRLIAGIQSVLDDDNDYLVIVLTKNSKETEQEVIRELLQKGAAGLIIFPVDAETYNEEILALKMAKYPFVLIDRYFPGVETHFVCSDNQLGAKMAVDHLWELGHRNIAICSDSPLPTMTVSDRISGYMEALKEKKALINPSMILTDFFVDYSQMDEQHPLYRYLKNEIATAFITLNGRLGLYLKAMANRIGLSIPKDISIVTFDDPSSDYDSQGVFTYINQFEEEIGRRSAQVLLDVIRDPEQYYDSYQNIVLKPELMVKQSTGPVALREEQS